MVGGIKLCFKNETFKGKDENKTVTLLLCVSSYRDKFLDFACLMLDRSNLILSASLNKMVSTATASCCL